MTQRLVNKQQPANPFNSHEGNSLARLDGNVPKPKQPAIPKKVEGLMDSMWASKNPSLPRAPYLPARSLFPTRPAQPIQPTPSQENQRGGGNGNGDGRGNAAGAKVTGQERGPKWNNDNSSSESEL